MRKNAKKYITLNCKYCNKTFNKELKEYNRKIKKGSNNFYCSKDCCNNGISRINLGKFGIFGFYMTEVKKCCKSRNREFDIDAEFLQNKWEEQDGICPYTGIKMNLKKTYRDCEHNNLCSASIDRIDSSKGYMKGNIEFVCRFINFGKNGYSKKETLNIINLIKNNGSLRE